MREPSRATPSVAFWLAAGSLAAATLLASCGGGGGGSSVPVATASATPTPGQSFSAPATLSESSDTAVSVGSTAAGYSASVTLSPASGAASVETTLSANEPSGTPVLSSAQRLARSVGGSPTGLLYATITSNATVSFATTPSFTFTLSSGASQPIGPTYVALDSGNGWQFLLGPGTTQLPLGGSSESFSFTAAATSFTLVQGVTYVFAFYSTAATPAPTASPSPTPTPSPTASPTPTPSPTPSPSPTPTPLPGVQLSASTPCTSGPTCLQFQVEGSPVVGTFTASEFGYAGTFTASDLSCTVGSGNTTGSVASLQNATATPGSAGGPATFGVIGTDVGSCTVLISDSKNPVNRALMTIQVASVSFGLQ